MPDDFSNPWDEGGKYWNSNATNNNALDYATGNSPRTVGENTEVDSDSASPHGIVFDAKLSRQDKAPVVAALNSLRQSRLFRVIYNALNASQNVFLVRKGRTFGNAAAQFAPNSYKSAKGGIITYNSEITSIDPETLAEEFMHAYQNELFASAGIAGSNLELESKIFTRMVLFYEIGTIVANTSGTRAFMEYLDKAVDFQVPAPAFLESKDFLTHYKQGLTEFVAYWRRIAQSTGQDYPTYTATPSSQPPVALIRILRNAY